MPSNRESEEEPRTAEWERALLPALENPALREQPDYFVYDISITPTTSTTSTTSTTGTSRSRSTSRPIPSPRGARYEDVWESGFWLSNNYVGWFSDCRCGNCRYHDSTDSRYHRCGYTGCAEIGISRSRSGDSMILCGTHSGVARFSCARCGSYFFETDGVNIRYLNQTRTRRISEFRCCLLCAAQYEVCTRAECVASDSDPVHHMTTEDPHDSLGLVAYFDEIERDSHANCDACRNAEILGDLIPVTVNYYSYKPRPNFVRSSKLKDDARASLFLGMENEINFQTGNRKGYNSAGKALLSINNGPKGELVYLKADGSIPYGYEVVSHPFTWGAWNDEFPHDIWSVVEENGGSADAHCGIHVHVSRNGFDSTEHTMAWMQLWCSPTVLQPFQAIAGRGSGTYSSWDTREVLDYARDKASGSQMGNRYSMLNFGNAKTIEVRAFRNSVKANEILARLGLVAATVGFSRTYRTTADLVYANFSQWISERADRFPDLAAMMSDTSAMSVVHDAPRDFFGSEQPVCDGCDYTVANCHCD